MRNRCVFRWRMPLLAATTILALSIHGEASAQEPPILEPGGPRAASELEDTPGCSDDEFPAGQVLLKWRPAAEPGTQQHVHVTIFREGFETGRFITIRDLEPSDSELLFEEVAGQALHRWRVLTLHPDGFVPSETARFDGPICVRDEDEDDSTVPQ